MNQPPVIIIGMHRSGTSMIAEMLEQCGLFSGAAKDPNHEPKFFLSLNDWIMQQCGAFWDLPGSMSYLTGDHEIRALISDHLRHVLHSPLAIRYLGWKRYLQYRDVARLAMPWGWKDPRNTYTLPFWLDIFPDAKIIHIIRHGVDVANSLKVRQLKVLRQEEAIYQRRRPLYALIPKKGRFANTVRCLTLEGGFSLWEEYMQEAKKQTALLGNRAIEIRYEDCIANAADTLKNLADFCGLRADTQRIAGIAGTVRAGRTNVHSSDAILKEFTEQVSARLRLYHY